MQCRICGNFANNKRYELREMFLGLREKFAYFQCSQCECLQIQEFPGNMAKYYPADYYSFAEKIPLEYFKKNKNVVLRKLKTLRNDYAIFNTGILGKLAYNIFPNGHLRRAILFAFPSAMMSNLINKKSRILDVGCGNGSFLHLLKEYGFASVLGVDPFIDHDIEYTNGLRILRKNILDLKGEFDLIMFHHSFEHIAAQVDAIIKVSELLSDSGTCLIRLPTVSSYAWEHYRENWCQADAPRHFFLHSIKSLRKLSAKANLRVEKIVYDSRVLQFVGSEAYTKDIPLIESKSIFSESEIREYKQQAEKLNAENRGDSVAFYLKKI